MVIVCDCIQSYINLFAYNRMELQELWEAALNEIELSISRANFATWFKNSYPSKRDDGTITIACHNGFTKEWLENRYNKIILRSLRAIDPKVKNLEYVIQIPVKKPERKQQARPAISLERDMQLELGGIAVDKDTNLNSRYSFENFVVGSHNELAHAAALAVTENPGTKYNPLFIYGGVGLGKTHLIQAVGNALREKYGSKKRITYITSEQFSETLVNAIRKQTMNEFKQIFRTVDLLLIDDVQFFAGKDKVQEELFHTFNDLHTKNKQIVFTSDRPPKAIPSIEERLRSRFEGGMIADISFPDLETRIAILKSKLMQKQADLDDTLLETIALSIQRNIRELEGALNRILTYSKIKGKNPTPKEAESILSELVHPNAKNINLKTITKVIMEYYDIDEQGLLKQSRAKEFVRPRQIAMYLLREILKMSYPTIGSKLGGRDHTTVIHACEKIGKSLAYDLELSQEISALKEKIYYAG